MVVLMEQITDTVLMIRPGSFRSNEETAINNYFQHRGQSEKIKVSAQLEFDHFVATLRKNDIQVIVIENDPDRDTPDALFPNNWISLHQGSKIVIYPMFAENRRRERDLQLLNTPYFQKRGQFQIIDLSPKVLEGEFLEGTGSMILDRKNRKAYCALSPRSSENLFHQFCQELGFSPISFKAYQTHSGQRKLIYHTNVMLSIGDEQAIICADAIDDEQERKKVINALTADNKEIVTISESQVEHFAGNMLQLKNKAGEKLLIMSETAYKSLNQEQLIQLSAKSKIVNVPLPTIEKFGGGSARCMLAEIF